ncbi:MAG: hypothetical protein QW318_09370 [Candidatus Caldarchaeum sp.]
MQAGKYGYNLLETVSILLSKKVKARLLTHTFPPPIRRPEEAPQWTSSFAREIDRYTLQLEQAITGQGFNTNADMLDGKHLSQILAYTRAFTNYTFPAGSGPVLQGHTGLYWRIFVEDMVLGLEPENSPVNGDFKTSNLILQDRSSGSYFRFLVDDTSAQPVLGLQAVPPPQGSEFWFNMNFGPVLVDRATQKWVRLALNEAFLIEVYAP